MKEPLLKIRNLTKSFKSVSVLKNIDLNIYEGEILGVIGASGSGKTTLLNAMIGFLPAESGEIEFLLPNSITNEGSGTYKSVYKDFKIIKNLYGFGTQLPSFYEKLTVKENLEFFGKMYDLNEQTINSNVITLLKLMDLENSANILGKNLSGGMERRLDIACALVHNPHILILDEPTADLDPVLRNSIWELIRKINKKGTTVILSSHHLTELESLCTRIAMIKDGQLLAVGSAEELRKNFQVKDQIIVRAHPGNFKNLNGFVKKYQSYILGYEQKGDELRIISTKPQSMLTIIIKYLDSADEDILELKLAKPDLDHIFITMNK